ncbi:MAG: hypothetical protein F6K16_06330 [Symploca sp. SIO2B6]|nr:hypothetical protein [Symploca sp. SIO2B6]
MIVPVKADQNPYNPAAQWLAAGSPQFFGGSPQGTTPLDTMIQEVHEESRTTLELLDTSEESFFSPSLDAQTKLYFFYSLSPRWRETGKPWNPNPQQPQQREMKALVTVNKSDFQGLNSQQEIINKLIAVTQTTGASGINDFRNSYTATAFFKFIKEIWPTT